MPTTNHSVWQDKPGVPGTIREDPILKLEDEQLLLRVHAWAMNPCDAMLQDKSLPVPGCLGPGRGRHCRGRWIYRHFQVQSWGPYFWLLHQQRLQELRYSQPRALAAKVPESLSFNDASVFPLCVTTSALALFGKDYLALPFPTLDPTSTGKSVLIWGGSSAVGSNAIQLAKAAGFEVVTTCSPRSSDYVQSLGASKVFDYNSPSVTDDVAAELDKGTCAGIYLAAGKVAEACQVSHKSKQKLFVASSNPVMPRDAPEGFEAKMTFGTTGADAFNEILPVTFGGFLPEALAKGVYKVAPPPEVVPAKGLEDIQDALDILKKGVSATKLVVEAE